MAQTITATEVLDRGIGVADIAAAAVAATDAEITFKNTGSEILFVVNADAGAREATLVAIPDFYGRGGGGDNDEVISVPADGIGMFPLMNVAMFGSTVTVNLDATANTSLALFRLRKVA